MAAGGVIPGTLIGGALALGLIGFSWWFGGILDAKDEAFGDVIELPKEAKAAPQAKARVGRSGRTREAANVQGMSLTHSDSGK